jgi:hypothetical protein
VNIGPGGGGVVGDWGPGGTSPNPGPTFGPRPGLPPGISQPTVAPGDGGVVGDWGPGGTDPSQRPSFGPRPGLPPGLSGLYGAAGGGAPPGVAMPTRPVSGPRVPGYGQWTPPGPLPPVATGGGGGAPPPQMGGGSGNHLVNLVRSIRQGVDFPFRAPMDMSFWRMDPTLQDMSLRGLRSRFGVPLQDSAAQYGRWLPRGMQGALAQGY